MADQLDVLRQLQVIDGQLFQLRRQLEEKPRELDAANARVVAQEQRLKTAEERMRALQMSQKEKEIELQTREANAKKLQGQLFQVKTNKEYTTMQREIDAIKADNSLLEEEILKLFDATEQASKERQTQQRALAEEQERLKVERAKIEQELAAIKEQMAQLERDRQTVVPGLPPPTLVAYERVLDIREGLALVPVVGSSCGGCHRRLPPQVVNEVLLKAKLVTCENCNRILYVDEAHSAI